MSPLYAGIGGVVRELTEMYTGINGVVKPMTEMWAGIDGVKRKIFSAKEPCSVTITIADDTQSGRDVSVGINDVFYKESGTVVVNAMVGDVVTMKVSNTKSSNPTRGYIMIDGVIVKEFASSGTIRESYTLIGDANVEGNRAMCYLKFTNV